MFVKGNFHRLPERFFNLASCGVNLVEDGRPHPQPCLGLGLSHEFANLLNALKNDALSRTGQMGKQTMFNRVVF